MEQCLGLVLEAGDVETLIRSLAESSPGLLLLNWSLYSEPVLETFQLLLKTYPALKVILLSANAADQAAAEKIEASFVHKGSAPEKLLATLASLLEGYH